ncbi:MAG: type IV secretion system protein, partial [Actinomycetota bacterium]
VKGAALRFLKLTWLAGPQAGPVLQMLLGIAIIIGSMLLWAVLLFRKAAVLLVAVFAPVAFAGAAWDQTRVWTRRWIEAMAALVLCKVVIVVVFVVGMSAFGSDGTTTTPGTPDTQPTTAALSDLLVGLILLSIAVFAPWLTWRFVHWSGMEAASVLHGTMAASPIPGAVRSTASQTRYMAQSAATTALLRGAGGAVRGGGAAKSAARGVGAASRPGGTQPPTPRSASSGNPAPRTGTATTTVFDPSRRGPRRDGDQR